MKKINKVTTIKYVRIVAFVLAFVLICYSLSQILFSNAQASRYGSSFSMAYSYTDDPENSLQIAGFGNSDLMSGFVPTKLWENYGYTSTLLSAGLMKPYRSYEMMQEFFKVQSPNLVIIEVDMFYEGSISHKAKSTDSLRDRLDAFFVTVMPEQFESRVENKFTLFRFHDRWKHVSDGGKSSNATPSSHGYKYCAEIQAVKNDKYMRKTGDIEAIPQDSLESLNKMVSLCREKGADVMLLEMPSATSWDYERHNAVQQYADENGLQFVDLNVDIDGYDLNYKKDFRDSNGNHLNYYGALKATNYIGSVISQNYKIESRSQNPDYDYWNDYCSSFKNEITGVSAEDTKID